MKTLRRRLAGSTVTDVVSLLSTILGDAVQEGMIGASPCRSLRTRPGEQSERPQADAGQVVGIAARCVPTAAALIVTAAYTGLRWGELAGLQGTRLDPPGTITVDPEQGALHEIGGRLEVGPRRPR